MENEKQLSNQGFESFLLAFVISCLIDIILCKSNFDSDVLKQREKQIKVVLEGFDPRNLISYDYKNARLILASDEAKKTAGNPDNIRGLLVSVISHTNMGEMKGPRCPKNACDLPIDKKRQKHLVKRIKKGYRLSQLKTPEECRELIGTHLTEEQVSKFVKDKKKSIHFTAQQKRVKKIFEQIEVVDSNRG